MARPGSALARFTRSLLGGRSAGKRIPPEQSVPYFSWECHLASGTLASRPAMQRTCRDILHIHIPRATSFTLPQNNRNDFRVLHAVLRIGSILAQLILVGVPAGTYRCSSLSLGPFGRLHATSSTCRIVVRLSIRRRSPIGARVAQHTSMIVALASLLRFKTKNSRLLAHLRGGDEEVRSRCSAPSRRVRVRRPAQGHDGAHLRDTSGSDITVCDA